MLCAGTNQRHDHWCTGIINAVDTDAVVEVSWPGDRRRYAKAVREFPAFRSNRKWSGSALILGVVLLIVGMALGSSSLQSVAIGAVGGSTLVFLWFFFIRFLVLRRTIDGIIRWRFDDGGIRIQGYVATEAPWAEVHSWYIAGDHLIVVPRNHVGRRSHSPLGVAAPIGAFSEAELTHARSLLEHHVGPEST